MVVTTRLPDGGYEHTFTADDREPLGFWIAMVAPYSLPGSGLRAAAEALGYWPKGATPVITSDRDLRPDLPPKEPFKGESPSEPAPVAPGAPQTFQALNSRGSFDHGQVVEERDMNRHQRRVYRKTGQVVSG